MATLHITPKPIVYPESDGKPMAENTLQFEWIATIKGGLESLFLDRPDVFVAGDLFWYPIEGKPGINAAPDTLVVFGRPPGHRGSYKQWEEEGVAPQVVFEVLSPGNRGAELMRKFAFYDQYGVEEYYIYDPDPETLELGGYLREGGRLKPIPVMNGFVSPRLGVRFEMYDDGLRIVGSDGRVLATYSDLFRSERAAKKQAEAAIEREQAALGEIARLKALLAESGIDPDNPHKP